MRILVISQPFPSSVDEGRGVFVFQRVRAMAEIAETEVRVVSPVPWFPPVKLFRRWYGYSQYPRREIYGGVSVERPRYPLPPKAGGYIHSDLIYPAVRRAALRLRESGFAFDIIDAHFVYPSGVAAARLGRELGIPVVVTGRGEDMLRFPSMPLKGRRIRWALRRVDFGIALSSDIASAMRAAGLPSDRIEVIANGVDLRHFRPLDRDACRRELGLETGRPIVLSVGDRLELKGFHLLIEALPAVLADHPRTQLVVVGGPGRHGRDYTREIQDTIARLRLEDHVRLVGPRPHHELPKWYSAADVFALLSSREGSPNVLLEALACGTPAIGTPLPGIRDELRDSRLGVIVAERTAGAAADALKTVLGGKWDSKSIRSTMEQRDWSTIGMRARAVLAQVHQSRRLAVPSGPPPLTADPVCSDR